MPRITVMMPARDAEQTIGQSIKSVYRALPKDSEVVVWDDASTDRTVEEVEKLGLERVRIQSTSTAVGSGVARGKIMEASDSEFVACMDADDVCAPWRFASGLLPSSNAELRFFPMFRFGKRVRSLRVTRVNRLRADEVRLALLVHNPLAQPTMIASRSALESVGGYSTARLGQDYELWLRAAARGVPIERSGPPVIAYRVSEHQVTRRADYREKFTGDAAVQQSYRELVASVDPALAGAMSGRPSAQEIERVIRSVKKNISTFSSGNRRYYSRLLSRESIGISL